MADSKRRRRPATRIVRVALLAGFVIVFTSALYREQTVDRLKTECEANTMRSCADLCRRGYRTGCLALEAACEAGDARACATLRAETERERAWRSRP